MTGDTIVTQSPKERYGTDCGDVAYRANGGRAYRGQQVAVRVQVADQLEQQQAPLQQGRSSRCCRFLLPLPRELRYYPNMLGNMYITYSCECAYVDRTAKKYVNIYLSNLRELQKHHGSKDKPADIRLHCPQRSQRPRRDSGGTPCMAPAPLPCWPPTRLSQPPSCRPGLEPGRPSPLGTCKSMDAASGHMLRFAVPSAPQCLDREDFSLKK